MVGGREGLGGWSEEERDGGMEEERDEGRKRGMR